MTVDLIFSSTTGSRKSFELAYFATRSPFTVAFGARATSMGAEILVVIITLRATYASRTSRASRLDRVLFRDGKLIG